MAITKHFLNGAVYHELLMRAVPGGGEGRCALFYCHKLFFFLSKIILDSFLIVILILLRGFFLNIVISDVNLHNKY